MFKSFSVAIFFEIDIYYYTTSFIALAIALTSFLAVELTNELTIEFPPNLY